nr:DUF6290 family protein [uncultured Halomonas sp.]
MPTSVRLDEELELRLTHLAEQTGRTKAFYIRKLVEDNLDDLEDVYLAEKALTELRAGSTSTVSLDEVMREHGLED